MDMTQVEDGLWLAGALERDDLERARAAGISLVIDLREDGEPAARGLAPADEAREAAALGMTYRRVPFGSGGPWGRAFAGVDALLSRHGRAALLHCASGRRAAAAAVAVLGRRHRWPAEACARTLGRLGFDGSLMPALVHAVERYAGRPAPSAMPAGRGLGI